MPRRSRLTTPAEVGRWKAEIGAAMLEAQDRVAGPVGAALDAHGLTWDSPRGASAQLWPQAEWRRIVDAVVRPAAERVAADIFGTIRERVDVRGAWGGTADQRRLAAMLVDTAIDGGHRMASALSAGGLTAASNPPVVHPDARPTVGSAFQAAQKELNRLAENVASHMSNAAVTVLAQTATQYEPLIRNVWNCSFVPASRPDHMDADGDTVRAGQAFDVGGEQLYFPGDPDGSDEQTANCVAEGTSVVLPGLRHSMRRWYEGDLVRLRFARTGDLAVTPNHPILRADGQWLPARSLDVGDHCVSGRLVWRLTGEPDVQAPPSEVGQVHDSTNLSGRAKRIGALPPDFHGDGRDGEVEVATPDRLLGYDDDPASDEEVRQFGFAAADRADLPLGARSSRTIPVRTNRSWRAWRAPLSASRFVRSASQLSSVVRVGAFLSEALSGGASTDLDPGSLETAPHDVASDAEGAGDGEFALTLDVATDHLVGVDVEAQWAGWVYNFDTGHGWYVTDGGNDVGGILLRNCLCWLEIEELDVADLPAAEPADTEEGVTASGMRPFGFNEDQPRDDHGRFGETDHEPSEGKVVGSPTPRGAHTHCQSCGHKFNSPRSSGKCNSSAACEKRQEQNRREGITPEQRAAQTGGKTPATPTPAPPPQVSPNVGNSGGHVIDRGPGEQLRPLVAPDSTKGFGQYAVNTSDGRQVQAWVSPSVGPNERPSEAHIQATLSTLADLHEREPLLGGRVPSLRIVSSKDPGAGKGTVAFVSSLDPSTINVVGRNSERFDPASQRSGYMMPCCTKDNAARYIATHEYGHAHDFSRERNRSGLDSLVSRTGALRAIREEHQAGGLSLYGNSDPRGYEAYAETFAEYHMTGGTTDNFAAQFYASAFKWK